MKSRAVRLLVLCSFAVVPFFAACSDDDEAPSSHTVDLGGVMHHDGYTDPLANCTGCHGATLHGGSGPSCYSCHNTSDHTVNRSGVMHNQNVDCDQCHGPDNDGGLGPACSSCHG